MNSEMKRESHMNRATELEIKAQLHTWRARLRTESGQTTAEYGLVLLAAATIAMLVVAWAGGTGAIGSFFDAIIDKITSLIA